MILMQTYLKAYTATLQLRTHHTIKVMEESFLILQVTQHLCCDFQVLRLACIMYLLSTDRDVLKLSRDLLIEYKAKQRLVNSHYL